MDAEQEGKPGTEARDATRNLPVARWKRSRETRKAAKRALDDFTPTDGKPLAPDEALGILARGWSGFDLIPRPPQLCEGPKEIVQAEAAQRTAAASRYLAVRSGLTPASQNLIGLISAAFLAAALSTQKPELGGAAAFFLLVYVALLFNERRA